MRIGARYENGARYANGTRYAGFILSMIADSISLNADSLISWWSYLLISENQSGAKDKPNK
ncbi:hypothetical protein [Moorena sp. SIO4E2]|uniref:hypothetical protein n=1 Tax=Moorena sp. SIO4E2 TaxID=2607826 RepID=UPI0025811C30|nr:hypothetical protein [Moorena sp. SIO4E2]